MGVTAVTGATSKRGFAMRSPVNWAVLGLVIERTGYGYDLFQRFERIYGNMLELSCQAQVYKALDALEDRGLIERLPPETPVLGAERQPKLRLRYQATEQGRCSYRDWLIAQVTQERQRSALFALQVGALPPREALAVIERYEQHLLAERQSARGAPTLEGSSGLARKLAEESQRLEAGLALKWTAYARQELEATIDAHGLQR
jgi:DNA-binding PadR family transcriptional regulator